MARQGPRNAGIEPLLDPTTGRRTFRHLAGTGEGPRAAEVALQAALTVARQQRARMWELRAAYDLATWLSPPNFIACGRWCRLAAVRERAAAE
jgi:hypothetical protein